MHLGIDVGGTFTDFVLLDESTHELMVWKTLTSSPDPSTGVAEGLAQITQTDDTLLKQVSYIVHGTTLGANTVIERTGAKTALITTQGFRDILEMQRQRRPKLYDLFQDKPEPIIPRHHVFEVTERVRYDGEVISHLSKDDVVGVCQLLREQNFESVAVSFLHSYVNNEHELQTRQLLTEILRSIPVSLSVEIAPRWREYERTNTTVVNAYILPKIQQYLRSFIARLREVGYRQPFFLMQSNGGITTVSLAADYPVRVIESGPAAGVLAAAHIGRDMGLENVISFDMGGTTAKISLIEDGRPAIADEFSIDRRDLLPETGLPVSIPSIQLIEIGAGGGSVASVAMGTIRVGPQSTGAFPGPACYGRQDSEATVTDANLILGYLDRHNFLGGQLQLDYDAACRSMSKTVGESLGLSLEEAAWGVYEVVNTNMSLAMREATIQRGVDPRNCTVVAFGGAGPIHACRLAKELGIPRVVIPIQAGVFSALGLLVAGIRYDLVKTSVIKLDELTSGKAIEIYSDLERELQSILQASETEDAFEIVRAADMRYVGQGYELTVPVSDYQIGEDVSLQLATEFEHTYKERYGFLNESSIVEVVNWRLSAVGERPRLKIGGSPGLKRNLNARAKANRYRSVYFHESEGFVECPVFDWYSLRAGETVAGPAIVEARETSAVVLPGTNAVMDSQGNIAISL